MLSSSPDEFSPSLNISALVYSSSSESKRASIPDLMDNRLTGSLVSALTSIMLLLLGIDDLVVDFGELVVTCCFFLEPIEPVSEVSNAEVSNA